MQGDTWQEVKLSTTSVFIDKSSNLITTKIPYNFFKNFDKFCSDNHLKLTSFDKDKLDTLFAVEEVMLKPDTDTKSFSFSNQTFNNNCEELSIIHKRCRSSKDDSDGENDFKNSSISENEKTESEKKVVLLYSSNPSKKQSLDLFSLAIDSKEITTKILRKLIKHTYSENIKRKFVGKLTSQFVEEIKKIDGDLLEYKYIPLLPSQILQETKRIFKKRKAESKILSNFIPGGFKHPSTYTIEVTNMNIKEVANFDDNRKFPLYKELISQKVLSHLYGSISYGDLLTKLDYNF